MKIITEAIKVTINKSAGKLKSGYFAKSENIKKFLGKVNKVVSSEQFKNFKIIAQTGAAVGGIVVIVTQYYIPSAEMIEIQKTQKEIEEIKNLLKDLFERDGFKTENVETTIIEKDQKIEKLVQENQQMSERLKNQESQERSFKTQSSLMYVAGGILLGAILIGLKPAKALEIMEEIIKN